MTTDDLFSPEHASALLLDYLESKQRGKPDKFVLGEFLEAVRPLAMIVARQLGANDPEDASQDVLIHLIGILDRYDRNPKNLRAWLSTVIRNKMISLWRYENTRFPPGVDPELLEDVPEAEAHSPAETGVARHHTALALWLQTRFPSLKNPKSLAADIISGMLEGQPQRQAIKAILAKASPALHAADAAVVLQSSTIFLRMINLPDGRLDIPKSEFNEFSILPELALLTGVEPAQAVSVLLAGMTIKLN